MDFTYRRLIWEQNSCDKRGTAVSCIVLFGSWSLMLTDSDSVKKYFASCHSWDDDWHILNIICMLSEKQSQSIILFIDIKNKPAGSHYKVLFETARAEQPKVTMSSWI